jgi:hypothetical protein
LKPFPNFGCGVHPNEEVSEKLHTHHRKRLRVQYTAERRFFRKMSFCGVKSVKEVQKPLIGEVQKTTLKPFPNE